MHRALPLLAALALALVACGEDRETGTGTTTGPKTETTGAATEPKGKPVKTVELEESEFEISPKRVKVDKAGLYEFRVKNVGKTVHALEVEGQGSEVETEEIQPGKSATLKAQLEEGSYKLYCPVGNHEDQGMTGELTVGQKSGGGGAATTEDSGGSGY